MCFQEKKKEQQPFAGYLQGNKMSRLYFRYGMKRIIVVSAFLLFILLFAYCNREQRKTVTESVWLNMNDSVRYVGMQTCRTCHQSIYESFTKTGMGESFDSASRKKSSAIFDSHAIVYDKYKNFYYKPFWRRDSLFVMEFRLQRKDTVYKRVEQIKYIIGSGHHTNSHVWNDNGYLHQAPITFYVQKRMWDMAPGFEDGANSRWDRIVSSECMNCHNMYSDFDFASENKFVTVNHGIECERCHGPGSLHVQEKLIGKIIDTSKYADYTIVNPKRLPLELQTEVCQRCHLQGISVLKEGKTYFDFKPGMKLNEVMDVFMPRYKGGEEKFIMASHVDRMKQSQCFIQSKKMTCITCHNPHVSVTVTPTSVFNSKCMNCHTAPQHTCTAPESVRELKDNNCYGCHMPVSETMDIPHVTIHDHLIRIPVTNKEKNTPQQFTGLECMTTSNPNALLMAQGYLMMYESFVAKSFLLDSALKFLNQTQPQTSLAVKKEFIHYYFLKKDYTGILSWAKKLSVTDTLDAWNNYRVGEAYFNTGDTKTAEKLFQNAVNKKKDVPDFRNKLAAAMLYNNKLEESKILFEQIIKESPKYAPALSNLSYLYLLKGNNGYAEILVNKALALNPDYVEALMNKIAIFVIEKKIADAQDIAKQVLKIEPQNEKAKQVLQQLKNSKAGIL